MLARSTKSVCLAVFLSINISAYGELVKIPVMTPVYVQLDERVTSKKNETSEGDVVRAHVWRDVRVNGRVVINAGAPVFCRVSEVQKAKVAGRAGNLEIRAMSVPGVDGEEIALDGGYDKSGKSRMGAAISTAVILAWPLIFIKGKNAVLEEGTIFDCWVQAGSSVNLAEEAPPTISAKDMSGVVVEILYESIDERKKLAVLPARITDCTIEFSAAKVVAVNGAEIEAIELKIDKDSLTKQGDCFTGTASIDFKRLSKHFTKGINRFEIEVNGQRVEVVLDLEL